MTSHQQLAAPRVPTCWSQKDKCKHLALDESLLRVSYKGGQKPTTDGAAVRANCAIQPSVGVFYWEVHIVDKGKIGHIGVGLCAGSTSLGRLPGWDEHSYGYHADDGFLFKGSGGEAYGPTFTSGDTIGCCVNFRDNTVLFTKNGQRLAIAFRGILNEPLFPTVGMRTAGEVVEANFGQKPFVFDIESLRREEKAALLKMVRGTATLQAKGKLPALVLQYLIHSGYEKAAEAFSTATKAEAGALHLADISQRQAIGKLICSGQIQAAIDAIAAFPGLLDTNTSLSQKLSLHRFVEIVRHQPPEAAIEYSRQHLRIEACKTEEERSQLEDVLSLLAYEDPLASPVAHLLSEEHRQQLATEVNGALLEFHGQPGISDLERMIGHTQVAVQRLVAENVPAACLADVSYILVGAERNQADDIMDVDM